MASMIGRIATQVYGAAQTIAPIVSRGGELLLYPVQKSVEYAFNQIATPEMKETVRALITPMPTEALSHDHRSLLEIVLGQLPPQVAGVLTEDGILRRLVIASLKKHADGFIAMDNSNKPISNSSRDFVSKSFAGLENRFLKRFWDQGLALFREEVKKADIHGLDAILQYGFDFLDPYKSPKLYAFLKGKVETVFMLVVEEFLKEGKRIQQQDPTLVNLDDHSLIILGAVSVSALVGKEMLKSDSTPQGVLDALGNKFPGFKNIALPAKLVAPLLEVIKKQGLVIGIEKSSMLTALTSQIDTIDQELVVAWGRFKGRNPEDTSLTTKSAVEKPISQISKLASSVVFDLINEDADDSVASKMASLAKSNGIKFIKANQIKGALSAVAKSSAPEMQNIRQGIEAYTDAIIREVFARLGRKVKENDQNLLLLVQKIVIRLSARLTGKEIGQGAETSLAVFYQEFTRDLLITLGFNGKDDLYFLPKEIRQMAWEQISGDLIGNKIQEALDSVFSPEFIREQIVKTLESQEESKKEQIQQERASYPETQEEAENSQAMQKAVSNLYEYFLDQLFEKGKFINRTLKGEHIVQKVGATIADSVMNALVGLYGNEEGRPSLQKLVVDSLSDIEFNSKSVSLEDQVKHSQTALQTAKAKYKQAKIREKRTREDKMAVLRDLQQFKSLQSDLESKVEEHTKLIERLESAKLAQSKAKTRKNQMKQSLNKLEADFKLSSHALKQKHEYFRVRMVELITNIPKEQAQTLTRNLWTGFERKFTSAVNRVYSTQSTPMVNKIAYRIGEFVFLKVFGTLFAGGGFLASLLCKKAALKLDQFLENNLKMIKGMSRDVLLEVQGVLLKGPSQAGIRAAPPVRKVSLPLSEVEAEAPGEEVVYVELPVLKPKIQPEVLVEPVVQAELAVYPEGFDFEMYQSEDDETDI